MINYNIELSVNADYVHTLPALKQYDNESRILKVKIKDTGGTYLTDKPNYEYRFRALKPDGEVIYVPAIYDASKKEISYTLDQQVLAKNGTVFADFEIIEGDSILLSTQMIAIEVEPSPFSKEKIESASVITAIAGLASKTATQAGLIEKIKAEIEKSSEALKSKIGDVEEKIRNIETAETLRVEAEQERASAEQTRKETAKQAQTQEEQRAINERQRQEAEQVRASAESQRESKEANREKAERKRKDEENKRVASESSRAEAENLRISAEQKREEFYQNSEAKESERVQSENERKQAEEERKRSEEARKSAESLRSTTADTLSKQATAISERANQDHQNITEKIEELKVLMETLKRLESGELANDVANLKINSATKQELEQKIQELIGGAPEELNTLKEIVDEFKKTGSTVASLNEAISKKITSDEAQRLIATETNRLTEHINQKADKGSLASGLAGKVNVADYLSEMGKLDQKIAGLANSEGMQNALNQKVDKVSGKQLSTEDFTTQLKNKLNNLRMPINNLTTTNNNVPLSATQGKELKRLIDNKPNTPVVDNLESDSATSALSARQGKKLKELLESGGSEEYKKARIKIDENEKNAFLNPTNQNRVYIDAFFNRTKNFGLMLAKLLEQTDQRWEQAQSFEEIARNKNWLEALVENPTFSEALAWSVVGLNTISRNHAELIPFWVLFNKVVDLLMGEREGYVRDWTGTVGVIMFNDKKWLDMLARVGILEFVIDKSYLEGKLERAFNLVDFLLENKIILKKVALKKGDLDMFNESNQAKILSNTKFLESLLQNTSEFINFVAGTKEKAVKMFKHPAVAEAVAKNKTAVTEISTSYNALYGLVCNPTSARLFFESPHNNYERVANTLGEPTEDGNTKVFNKNSRQKAKTLKMWCIFKSEGYASHSGHVNYETDGTLKVVMTHDEDKEWFKSFKFNKVQFVTFENCTVDFNNIITLAYYKYWELK